MEGKRSEYANDSDFEHCMSIICTVKYVRCSSGEWRRLRWLPNTLAAPCLAPVALQVLGPGLSSTRSTIDTSNMNNQGCPLTSSVSWQTHKDFGSGWQVSDILSPELGHVYVSALLSKALAFEELLGDI